MFSIAYGYVYQQPPLNIILTSSQLLEMAEILLGGVVKMFSHDELLIENFKIISSIKMYLGELLAVKSRFTDGIRPCNSDMECLLARTTL